MSDEEMNLKASIRSKSRVSFAQNGLIEHERGGTPKGSVSMDAKAFTEVATKANPIGFFGKLGMTIGKGANANKPIKVKKKTLTDFQADEKGPDHSEGEGIGKSSNESSAKGKAKIMSAKKRGKPDQPTGRTNTSEAASKSVKTTSDGAGRKVGGDDGNVGHTSRKKQLDRVVQIADTIRSEKQGDKAHDKEKAREEAREKLRAKKEAEAKRNAEKDKAKQQKAADIEHIVAEKRKSAATFDLPVVPKETLPRKSERRDIAKRNKANANARGGDGKKPVTDDEASGTDRSGVDNADTSPSKRNAKWGGGQGASQQAQEVHKSSPEQRDATDSIDVPPTPTVARGRGRGRGRSTKDGDVTMDKTETMARTEMESPSPRARGRGRGRGSKEDDSITPAETMGRMETSRAQGRGHSVAGDPSQPTSVAKTTEGGGATGAASASQAKPPAVAPMAETEAPEVGGKQLSSEEDEDEYPEWKPGHPKPEVEKVGPPPPKECSFTPRMTTVRETVRPAMDPMQEESLCQHCGNKFKSDAKFCRLCGKPRVARATQLEEALCKHCGNKFKDDAKFCRKCGKPRGAQLEVQEVICQHCGNKFKGDAKFCRKCGKPRGNNQKEAPVVSCQHCGNVFLDDSLFCRKCGKPRGEAQTLKDSNMAPKDSKKETNDWKTIGKTLFKGAASSRSGAEQSGHSDRDGDDAVGAAMGLAAPGRGRSPPQAQQWQQQSAPHGGAVSSARATSPPRDRSEDTMRQWMEGTARRERSLEGMVRTQSEERRFQATEGTAMARLHESMEALGFGQQMSFTPAGGFGPRNQQKKGEPKQEPRPKKQEEQFIEPSSQAADPKRNPVTGGTAPMASGGIPNRTSRPG